MSIPVVSWLTQSIAAKLGVGISIEFASQIAAILSSRDEKTLAEYDRMTRDQSINNLSDARNELKTALYLSDQANQRVKKETYLLSRQISSLIDRIRFSESPREKVTDKDGNAIRYVNVMLLSRTYSILQQIKNLTDESTHKVKIDGAKSEIRKGEKILEIRNMMLTLRDQNIIKYLSDNNPDLFIDMRNLTSIIYRMDELKKPVLLKGRYYERVRGSLLYMMDDIIMRRGPIVSLAELYTDYMKEYPNTEINQSDFEKTVKQLTDDGLLDNLEQTTKGYKIVKIKPLKLTKPYQEVISLVSAQGELLEKGVTQEELTSYLGYDYEFTRNLLKELETDNVAWKHGEKYYFPGLAESAYNVKKEVMGLV